LIRKRLKTGPDDGEKADGETTNVIYLWGREGGGAICITGEKGIGIFTELRLGFSGGYKSNGV